MKIEGRSISFVDSIKATQVDSSSDRERVHTTQFDMTAGDTSSEIGPQGFHPRCSCGTSRSFRDWRHGCQAFHGSVVHDDERTRSQ